VIDIKAAEKLLHFGARIGEGQRAQEQLEGAVAVHNLLEKNGIAYIADEVGMGKTYVALGVVALFRHFQPSFRVLFIAPRENIQRKWMKEARNFVAYNVRYPDLRVKGIDGGPALPLVYCGNLLELVNETIVGPDRDFFARMTSFSLPVAGRGDIPDAESARRLRDGLKRNLPWLRDEVFDLRAKRAFKDNFAKALCCALPVFDLVVVDEAHCLKHGFEHGASRNRVLALAFGHPHAGADPVLFPGYGPRARRILFLSATPVEETYAHLYHQLDVFGRGAGYAELAKNGVESDRKKELAGQFLIRRVTSIQVNGEELTKNLYRREWRSGGVFDYDDPIRVDDPRARLAVALVQKKVAELLGHERFNKSFQIGMLASFESFLETTRLKRVEEGEANFDDSDQTDDITEREGIDVYDVNRLARGYRKQFGCELPHPKMDSVVQSLSSSWKGGKKTLVFVRRVASVKELKRKLDERYDQWLHGRLRWELPAGALPRLEAAIRQYSEERTLFLQTEEATQAFSAERVTSPEDDRGGGDTFFSWFFRGEGPRGFASGANVQKRFINRSSAFATFFEDNIVADILGCRPGEVASRLGEVLGVEQPKLRDELKERSKRFLTRAKKPPVADRFEAVQAAAVEWLKDHEGSFQETARIAWHERFESSLRTPHAGEAPDIGDWLETRTFFTELKAIPSLREEIWPIPACSDPIEAFRERELRARLLSTAARLGHALIDLYVLTIRRLGSLDARAQEREEQGEKSEPAWIDEYLSLLERQRITPLAERDWVAFDELREIAANYHLILDVNAADAQTMPLVEVARLFGSLLRQQQPVGGMSGQVNQTLVRQFRMPGYPFVLVTTDLLQEGEDLHTFCSAVQHYGISWTPSSMEQRIGRIDRVRSLTERRLSPLQRSVLGEEMLQVYYPYLDDTVEVLQVQTVLERMNLFLRLMHEGLTFHLKEDRRIDTSREFMLGRRNIPEITGKLKTAFGIRAELCRGDVLELIVGPEVSEAIVERFRHISDSLLPGLTIEWERQPPAGKLLGSVRFPERKQPFALLLRSYNHRVVVRCISPVGRVSPGRIIEDLQEFVSRRSVYLGAILTEEDRTYDLTVEGDVLLRRSNAHDLERVASLIRRITIAADELEQKACEGRDEPMDTFRPDIENEGINGR